MAIDILRDNMIKAMPESITKKVASGIKAKDASSSVVSSKEDSVSITDSAKTLARATEKAKNSDGIDHDKVEALKQSIADGSYKVDYQNLANKILDVEDEINSIFGL